MEVGAAVGVLVEEVWSGDMFSVERECDVKEFPAHV